jgi:hypothetical protein
VTQLPEAITRIWQPDAYEKMGGWCELAGVDPLDVYGVREFDHPWVGMRVSFPEFEGWGYTNGEVVKCLSHPRGSLMFDVVWPEPVPTVLYVGGRFKVINLDKEGDPAYWTKHRRYMANKFVALCHGDAKPIWDVSP